MRRRLVICLWLVLSGSCSASIAPSIPVDGGTRDGVRQDVPDPEDAGGGDEARPARPSCPPGTPLTHYSLTPLSSLPALGDLELPGPTTNAMVATAGTGRSSSVRLDVCRDSAGSELRAILLRGDPFQPANYYVLDESITSPGLSFVELPEGSANELRVPPAAFTVEGLTAALDGDLRPLRVRVLAGYSGLLMMGHAGFLVFAEGRVNQAEIDYTSSQILVGGLAPGNVFAGLRCPFTEQALASSFRLDTAQFEIEACGFQGPGITQGYRITRLAVQDSSPRLAEKDRVRFELTSQAQVEAALTYRWNHHNACDSFHLALPHADYAASAAPAAGCGPQVPNAPMRTYDEPPPSPLRYRIRYYGGAWRDGDAHGCRHFLLCD